MRCGGCVVADVERCGVLLVVAVPSSGAHYHYLGVMMAARGT